MRGMAAPRRSMLLRDVALQDISVYAVSAKAAQLIDSSHLEHGTCGGGARSATIHLLSAECLVTVVTEEWLR